MFFSSSTRRKKNENNEIHLPTFTLSITESMLGSSNLKPKYGKKSGFLPLPATFNRMNKVKSQNFGFIVIIIVILWLLFASNGITFKNHTNNHQYPPPHPLTSPHTIETTSRFIYPAIDHTPLLKELGVHKLVKESRVRDADFPEIEKTVIRSLNIYDDPNPIQQKAKEDEENALSDLAKAKNHFKNQDKVVYKPKSNKNYPEVIIVTAIDFDKYSLDSLIKIVQNRVDYAHLHNYGMYIRWYQEFLPALNSMSYLQLKEKTKWVRLYCLRAAMFAFPEAKWFWYLDQDGFIMNLNIDLQDYILSSESLNPIMKREQPIIPPDGIIKTYKNSKPASIKLIVTQSQSKIETNSMIVKNDDIGKGILDIWGDKLYLNYASFPFGPDSALTHLLQWHPFVLSKTGIIPARTIAAKAPAKAEDATFDYHPGDLVAQWSHCDINAHCEETLDHYYSILQEIQGKKT